eukprot:gene12758-biopygen12465
MAGGMDGDDMLGGAMAAPAADPALGAAAAPRHLQGLGKVAKQFRAGYGLGFGLPDGPQVRERYGPDHDSDFTRAVAWRWRAALRWRRLWGSPQATRRPRPRRSILKQETSPLSQADRSRMLITAEAIP